VFLIFMFSSGYPSVSNSILKFCYKRNWICKVWLVNRKNKKFSRNFLFIWPRLFKGYNTIHWINHHPLHNSIGLIVLLTTTYPMGKLSVCLLVLSNLWTTQGPGHWTVPALSWQDVNSGFVHMVYFYCNWFFGGQ